MSLPSCAPSVSLLHEFFERAATRWADEIAIDIPPSDKRPSRRLIKYGELAGEARAIAHLLRETVQDECVVAILLPRHSEYLFSGQLGVLQAGAAYTCLDPSFPDERIRETLEDSSAVALLTDAAGRARAVGFTGRVIDVTEDVGRQVDETLPPPAWLTPGSLAYTIYTSGTTGRPKAVMIEHRSIVNLVASDLVDFNLGPGSRVSQNSSAAYDSSVEEIWFALASGATLVVMDDEAVRLGPDLPAWLRRERIAFFCPPPTLLSAMACEDPRTELPDLAVVYAGGEPLSQDLADRWSCARELLNGYGPTECTVTAMYKRLKPGDPVSVGRPVPGIHAWVLNEALEEVAGGEWGELCLGGIGLARGYWNRPELTAEKFSVHPKLGRIYRTGDLVHRDAAGEYYCHGRIDSQVKIRGYRVELEEIETRLTACAGVRGAACRVESDTLAAFVVPDDPQSPPAFDALRSVLRQALPAHMVPARFGLIAQLPLTVGGKIDRARLPSALNGHSAPAAAAPRNATESELAGFVREVLGLPAAPSVHADFFSELGGDSLRAAQLITRLRREIPSTAIAVRDVYEAPTIAQLAERFDRTDDGPAAWAEPAEDTSPPQATSASRPFWATVIQSIWLLAGFSIASSAVYYVFFELAPHTARAIGLVPLLLLGPGLFFGGLALYTLLAVSVAVAAKRCLIGRYRALSEPVWSSFYVRNWMVHQVARAIPWWFIEGTEFQLAALRALGARIGQRVHLHRGVQLTGGGWDLLEIGDDVSVAQDASLGLVELDEGHVVVGGISLGAGVTVEIRAGLAPGTRMEAGASLAPLSWLAPGAVIPAGERWDGIPARPAGNSPLTARITRPAREFSPWVHGLAMVAARYVIGTLPMVNLELLALLSVVSLEWDANRLAQFLSQPFTFTLPLSRLILLAAIAVPLSLAIEAIIVRLLGRVREGVISRWSLEYIRVWMKPRIVFGAGEWLSGTLLWPVWLRCAGLRVARGCEISTILDTVPELVEIGDESFFADGIYLGGPYIHRSTVSLAVTRIGTGVFLGNHSVIPSGCHVSDGVLLGVCTVAGNTPPRSGSAWFGHPPFELPAREVVECDRSLTYEPSTIRYCNRVFWELLRFALPAAPLLVALAWFQFLAEARLHSVWSTLVLIQVPLVTLAAAGALCLLVLVLKWGLLGRVRPGQHPLWSCWCSRWDFLYVAWQFYSRGALESLEGTLLLTWYLRAMGVKIGKRVVLGGGFSQVVDPDMLTIEDGATLNCALQSHTFEDRVLKIDRVIIRSGATLGTGSVPLYGADIGAGTHVAPNSVIMKHEHLLPGLRYQGAPTRVAAGGHRIAGARSKPAKADVHADTGALPLPLAGASANFAEEMNTQ
jgi:non-ribosomal peptide synthetase-like protein